MTESTRNGEVLVVGSANMDLVVSCDRFPRPGETLFANAFEMFPGGKGANQATAAARLGAHVHFVGKMGNDIFRDRLTDSLARDGVHLDRALVDLEAPTGVALITVDGSGQNQILVSSGSNMRLRPDEVDGLDEVVSQGTVVLVQLEIPLDTVVRTAEMVRSRGARIILNPAPARGLPEELLNLVDVLTPNESEAEVLTGIELGDVEAAKQAGRRLLEKGVGTVVITLGHQGALLVSADQTRMFAPMRVEAVDTTAAGDAFNGALACALARGDAIDAAIETANIAGALTVTKRGAQASMPTGADVAAVLRSH
jgi:ribokinase